MGKKQHAGRQERAAKLQKKADKKAEAIIAKAKEEALERAALSKVKETPWDSEREAKATDEQWVLAVKVRELREQGEPWWAIARDLEMEGFGTSAATGKRGAARARTAYKAGFGSFPRTFTTGGYKGVPETNTAVAELKKKKRKDLRQKAKSGKSVIPKNMPDEEVAAMLKGRKIKWLATDIVPEGVDREVCIHPSAPFYIIGEGKERLIQFREQHRSAPIAVRWMPAHHRTIRLKQIYEVR